MSKITDLHIFDFDGTLVNSEHRYRCAGMDARIDLQFWLDNEHLAILDKPIKATCDFFRSVRDAVNSYAVIATARVWCAGADAVCKANDLFPNSLVARKGESDTRGGAELKIAHVDRLLNLKQFSSVDTIHIHEDNVDYLCKIADHYESKGFKVIGHYYPSEQGY